MTSPFLWLALLILPGIIWMIFWSYCFPLIAIFENTIGRTLKNLALLSIANFPYTLMICILNSIFPALLVFFPLFAFYSIPFWLFIGFSLIARCNAHFFGKIFDRLVKAKQKEASN